MKIAACARVIRTLDSTQHREAAKWNLRLSAGDRVGYHLPARERERPPERPLATIEKQVRNVGCPQHGRSLRRRRTQPAPWLKLVKRPRIVSGSRKGSPDLGE